MPDAALLAATVATVADLDRFVWVDIGPQLSCREADALADLFAALGLGHAADALRAGHAGGDAEGDDHYDDEEDPDA